mgnify:CR=1 FL=1
MIRFHRWPEPPCLDTIRTSRLKDLRSLIAQKRRNPASDEIKGYNASGVKHDLWGQQAHKCCYCESRVKERHDDVEHFRPKGEAARAPGSTEIHGYWWLSYSWENLLLSCKGCNQKPCKGVQFPLELGSAALDGSLEQGPPGGEIPLLIDPAAEDPLCHIQFRCEKRDGRDCWVPRPRDGSPRGVTTIRVCGLDRSELLDLYNKHVAVNVLREVREVDRTLALGKRDDVWDVVLNAAERLMYPFQEWTGLAHDALNHFVPSDRLAPHHLVWPKPPFVRW